MSEMGPILVMTWNIHGGVDRFGRDNLEQVIAVVKSIDPDIIALQEVDSRRKDRHPLERFEEALGHCGVGAAAITAVDGDYGQAVLSRWPMTSTEVHDISVPNREPRRAVASVVAAPCSSLWIVATHLGLQWGERRFQAKRLAAIAGARPLPTILLGDFNDWIWPGTIQNALANSMSGRTRHRTFPARLPILMLDRIYTSKSMEITTSRVITTAREISDHLPLVATVAAKD